MMGTCPPPGQGWGNLRGVSQVHVAVGHSKVRLYVDCRKVAEQPIGEVGSPPATGFVTLGRLAKARGPRGSSAAVSLGFVLPGGGGLGTQAAHADHAPSTLQLQLQLLQVVCSDTWAEEDRCCELPALVGGSAPPRPRRLGSTDLPGPGAGRPGRASWRSWLPGASRRPWGRGRLGWLGRPSCREAAAEHSGATPLPVAPPCVPALAWPCWGLLGPVPVLVLPCLLGWAWRFPGPRRPRPP